MEPVLAVAALVAAGLFAVVNGLTDAPHSFGPPVRTGALTPRIALVLSAVMTALGALLSTGIARTLTDDISFPTGEDGLLILLTGALGAAIWGLVAHRLRMPTSSTHSLVGALFGASIASQAIGGPTVATTGGFFLKAVALPLVISPIVAFAAAYGLTICSTLIHRGRSAHLVYRNARLTHSVVSAAFSAAHGVQDGQRTVFLATAALTGVGVGLTAPVMTGVVVGSAVALGLGALVGSWRIAHTLTHRMTHLDPETASVGSATAAGLLFLGMLFHMPISSTHVSTAGLLGAAEAHPFKPTRWSTVLRIGLFWLATPLLSGTIGAFLLLLLSNLL